MKVSFIGGGNMGEAILAALLKNGLSQPADIAVSDVKAERLDYLKTTYGIFTTRSNAEAAGRGDVVVLAVKPQNLDDIMSELSGKLKPSQLVLTIIAGKSLETLSQGLKHQAIVRAMPNTPAQIGKGMTVWTATSDVTTVQTEMAKAILGVMGRAVYVGHETYLDMATAVSGSGPAYVFLFMESLIAAAMEIGMPETIAKELVLQTLLGSAEFAQKADKDLAELRRMVTSPGGTTAEALKVLELGEFNALIKRAVAAAYQRAKELGG